MITLRTLAFITLISLFFSYVAVAQDENEESPLSVSATLVNSYIWRGMTSSAAPNFQPSFTYSFGGFYAGTWGSTDFTGNYKELDLLVGYSIGPISATVYDYFWSFPEKYFDYSKSATSHLYEFELVFEPEALPIRIQVATMFYGADKKYSYSNETDSTKNNYSTYFELGYNINLKGNNLYPFIGITPFDGMYGTGLNVINAGITASRDIKITDKFVLPISVSAVMNPQTQDYFCVFGFTL